MIPSTFPFGLRAHDYGRHSEEELAGLLASRGAHHAQLAPGKALAGVSPEPGSFTPERAIRTADAFRTAGLEVSVLGCYVDLLDPDPVRRGLALSRFLEALERAPVLGAALVATESFGARAGDAEGRRASLADLLRALEPIARRAEELGVDFALEPVRTHVLSSPGASEEVLRKLGSPRLFILLDPVNLCPPPAGSGPGRAEDLAAPALECLDRFADRIRVLHLKDFRAEDGGNRVVPPGKGLFPFPEFFRAAAGRGLRCPCVVEDCRPGDLSGALAFLEESGAGLVAGP